MKETKFLVWGKSKHHDGNRHTADTVIALTLRHNRICKCGKAISDRHRDLCFRCHHEKVQKAFELSLQEKMLKHPKEMSPLELSQYQAITTKAVDAILA